MSSYSAPRRSDPLTDFVLRATTTTPVPGAPPRPATAAYGGAAAAAVQGGAAVLPPGARAPQGGGTPREAPQGGRAPQGSDVSRADALPAGGAADSGQRASAAGARPGRSSAAGANTRTTGPMARSRAAILDGARAAVEANGTKITMAQVAARGGVAKATLYNHFRAREDVLAALLLDEIDRLVAAVWPLELSRALTAAAVAISEHPLLEALGGQDTTTLAVLARVDVRSPGWARVAFAVEQLLRRDGRAGTPTVLRWLSSYIIAPADEADIAADVAVLVAGLPPAQPQP